MAPSNERVKVLRPRDTADIGQKQRKFWANVLILIHYWRSFLWIWGVHLLIGCNVDHEPRIRLITALARITIPFATRASTVL
jgi:hypothetical protein